MMNEDKQVELSGADKEHFGTSASLSNRSEVQLSAEPAYASAPPHFGSAQQPARRRVVGFDIARVLAIFGMVVVNYGLTVKYEYLAVLPDFNFFLGTIGIFSGRAAATFVILAGIGTSLALVSAQRRGAVTQLRVTLVKRALFLFVLGYSWFFLDIWSGDILHFYGLFILAGVVCLTLPSWGLWVGIALLMAGSVLYQLLGDGHYWDTMLSFNLFGDLFLNGLHPFVPWFAFYLYGMWLGRQDFSSRRLLWSLAGVAVVALVAAEVFGILGVGKFPLIGDLFDLRGVDILQSAFPLPPTPLYLIAGASTSTLVILGCLWFGRRFGQLLPVQWVVQTGQMALTIYIGHIVVGLSLLVLLIEAFEPSDTVRQVMTLSAVVIFFFVAVAFSALWRTKFQRGPFEVLLRAVSGNSWRVRRRAR